MIVITSVLSDLSVAELEREGRMDGEATPLCIR